MVQNHSPIGIFDPIFFNTTLNLVSGGDERLMRSEYLIAPLPIRTFSVVIVFVIVVDVILTTYTQECRTICLLDITSLIIVNDNKRD